MARISGVSAEEAIRRIHAAGLDSFAGAGAELLPERPRKAIAPLKESGERWLEIMELAHNLGVESTSTMLMGTGETNAERIEHIAMIRDVQDRTGGFRAFIPYTYQPENNHLKGRTQATVFEYLRMIAIARLFLDNVAHIQGSWLTVGKEAGQLALHYGADDLGSIMLEENVVSSAGAKHRSNRQEIIDLIRKAGRVPAQRATTYEHLVVHEDPANDPVDDRVVSHICRDRAGARRGGARRGRPDRRGRAVRGARRGPAACAGAALARGADAGAGGARCAGAAGGDVLPRRGVRGCRRRRAGVFRGPVGR
jgi:cyclic dehypoxanthinyl futalosine synthase